MYCPPQPQDPLVEGWIARHQNPFSFCIHLIGIPSTILGPILLPIALVTWSMSIALLGIGLFVGGYAIQFLGHAVDGTEPGELIFLKRKLGFARVEIAPSGGTTQSAV